MPQLATIVNRGQRFDSQDDWLRARLSFVTASQVATLMGENPYQNIRNLAKEKLEKKLTSFPDRPPMWWGRRLEGVNGQAFRDLYGGEVWLEQLFFGNRHVAATLDGLWYPNGPKGEHPNWIDWGSPSQPQDLCVLELKNTDAWGSWNDVPPYYWWQVQSQMHCTGLTDGLLVAKIGAARMRAFHIEYDSFAMKEAAEKATHFMENLEKYVK